MQDLIRILVQALVDRPEKVVVSEVESDHVSIFEVSVDQTDTGKLIGKHGRNAEALRTLVNAVAAKHRRRTLVQILA
ncbi:MAG: KH domain-containing protein [Desulfobacterales bacterium]